MKNGLLVFQEEFLSYILSSSFDGDISFGNLIFDFDLKKIDGEYILDIYDVALDHYGMPMRNVLSFERYNISHLMGGV